MSTNLSFRSITHFRLLIKMQCKQAKIPYREELEIEIQDKTLTLVNIYAPNKDESSFFKMFMKNCLLLTVIS